MRFLRMSTGPNMVILLAMLSSNFDVACLEEWFAVDNGYR
jgi:hypothetical protein